MILLVVAVVAFFAGGGPAKAVARAVADVIATAIAAVGVGPEGVEASGGSGPRDDGIHLGEEPNPFKSAEVPAGDPCSDGRGVIASGSGDDGFELAPCPFESEGSGGLLAELGRELAERLNRGADRVLEGSGRVGRWIDERITGSPSPRSDVAARAMAVALEKTVAGAEVLQCGRTFGGRAVVCVNNVPQAVPEHADAWTLGHFVFCRFECSPGSDLVAHELVHVEQFEKYGDAFVAMYLKEAALNGTTCNNRFEVPAYERNWPCPHD